MNNIMRVSIIIIIIYLLSGCTGQQDIPSPPKAKKIPKELTIHGDSRIDNYYWLKERDNPEVIDYLKAENTYTDAVMAHTKDLQEKLFNEIVGRIKQTDESVPYKKNGYFYYDRYEEGNEYPIYCRKKGTMDTEEEILLNVNEMAKGHNYFHVRSLSTSSDNQLLAFGVDTIGRRKYIIRFKNLATGELLDDKIENTNGSAAWANDNRTVFYTTKDETLRPYKILKHKLGEVNDTEVYHEQDSTFDCYVYKSKSDKYLMIISDHTLSTEYRFLNADQPDGTFKVVHPREKDLEYHVDHYKDKFYIRTNWQAKNFKLMETPVTRTNKKYWKDVIGHRENVLLENMELFKNFLVLQERKNGLTQLRIIKWHDMNDHYLDFGEPAYVAYISDNPEFDTDVLRYTYMSLTTPKSTFDYNMKTKEKKLMKQQEVVGDFAPSDYQTERLMAEARDGTKIPISLVYKKDKKKENMPLLLYGYGSYGYSMDPYFSSVRLSLLDRGFIYAIAHIRGGQEMGRWWYEDGKLFKKKNTFTDFIDCGKYLVEKKYTSPQKLFAEGGSAGGLLMGAVMNMQPDLFKGFIAAVPFVDIVTTMSDESIPLTTAEYDEWGNPNEKDYYEYILSYSPYDNVEAKQYPALLVTTSLHDSQVQYWEPAKWVAKLRELKTDNNLLLLKTDMEAGHSGTTGRFKQYRDTALEYAFILDQAGIDE
jgi:oligopeptidase B